MKQRKVKERVLPLAESDEYRDEWKRTDGIDIQEDLDAPTNEHWYRRDKRLRRIEAYFRLCIAEGLSRDEIMARMGWSDAEYDRIERRVLETDAARFTAMGTAHRYYVYMLQQEQCAHELDVLLDEMRKQDSAPATAMVAAVKAKSKIFDNTIRMGQELGVIAKRAKEIRVVGQVNLATMSNDELAKMYDEMLGKFAAMVEPNRSLPSHYQKMLETSYEDKTSDQTGDGEEQAEEFESEEVGEPAA